MNTMTLETSKMQLAIARDQYLVTLRAKREEQAFTAMYKVGAATKRACTHTAEAAETGYVASKGIVVGGTKGFLAGWNGE